KTANTGDRLKTGSLSRISTPNKLMLPSVLAIQTWAICRSIKVTGPARRRKAQKIDAQVPKPRTQIAKYGPTLDTFSKYSQFVAEHKTISTTLCHIQRRPQFSSTAA